MARNKEKKTQNTKLKHCNLCTVEETLHYLMQKQITGKKNNWIVSKYRHENKFQGERNNNVKKAN